MSYTDRMTTKLRAIQSRLPDAIKDLNRGNARAILEVSQPLVPVDTGALKRSGRVEPARKQGSLGPHLRRRSRLTMPDTSTIAWT